VPDSGAIHTGKRRVCGQTGIEIEVYNLPMLISAHSMAEASYGNGSVSLDASGYQRLVCSKDKEKAMWWV
jgi:hypothetical protein